MKKHKQKVSDLNSWIIALVRHEKKSAFSNYINLYFENELCNNQTLFQKRNLIDNLLYFTLRKVASVTRLIKLYCARRTVEKILN